MDMVRTSRILLAFAVLQGCESASSNPAVDNEDGGSAPGSWLDESKDDDACPTFHAGVNYAWEDFGADFGGLAAWGQPGVRGNAQVIRGRLEAARDAGATVVRWWLWPDFRGDGVQFDETGTPTGVSEDALADLDAALRIADEVGIDIMLCFFSFDAFDPDAADLDVGHIVPSLTDITVDDTKRRALIERVVIPVAQRVRDSAYNDRMVAWDVMNEPEWAIRGSNPYGDPAYTPMSRLDTVSHREMEQLLADMITGLDSVDDDKMTSVGAAAFKWSRAWSELPTDFHHFHMYDWIDRDWPYDEGPAAHGLSDKPVFMGEIHFDGLSDAGLPEVFATWKRLGYLGAMGWSLTDPGDEGQAAALAHFREAVDGLGCD